MTDQQWHKSGWNSGGRTADPEDLVGARGVRYGLGPMGYSSPPEDGSQKGARPLCKKPFTHNGVFW